jgi:hypothetical protein
MSRSRKSKASHAKPTGSRAFLQGEIMENVDRDLLRTQLIQFFGRHIVALGGTYVRLDEKGNPKGPETFFCYSACVLAVRDEWWIATAGHIFNAIERMTNRGEIRILSQSLADYFGVQQNDPHPIPFDFMSMRKVWKDEDGLDFAVIPLPPFYRRQLEGGHIRPFDELAWRIPQDIETFKFAIVGFPDHLIAESRLSRDEPVVGYVKPVLAFVEGLPCDSSQDHSRFCGRLLGKLSSAVGLSGGPVLAFLKQPDGKWLYCFIGIQSSWEESTRIVYGCPVHVFLPIAEKMLNEEYGS